MSRPSAQRTPRSRSLFSRLFTFRVRVADLYRRERYPRRTLLTLEVVEGRAVPAALTGSFYLDTNGNGVWDASEGTTSGVQATLTPAATPAPSPLVTASSTTLTTSAATGYSFDELEPGWYGVTFTPPPGYVVTSPAGGATTVLIGTANVDLPVGIVATQPGPPTPAPGVGLSAVSIAPTNTTEGSSTPGSVTFTRSGGDLSRLLTVGYTVGGSAVSGTGNDYTALPGSVTFAAGQTTAVAVVEAFADAVYDPNETVTLTVYPGPDYTLAGDAAAATAVVVILDGSSVVAVDDAVTVGLDPVVVPVLDNDYETTGAPLSVASVGPAAHGTVSLAGGVVTFTATDPLYEGTDTFTYTVASPNGGTASATVTVTLTATDSDELPGEDYPYDDPLLREYGDGDGSVDPNTPPPLSPPMAPPVPPAAPPTSDQLTWDHFEKVDKPKKNDHAAMTAWFETTGEGTKLSGGAGTATTAGGKTTFTTSYEYKDVKFVAVFSPKNSWVVKGKETDALLKHEKLHLRIAEYTAEKANANKPDFKSGDKTATDPDKAKAIAAAKKEARDAVTKQMTDYRAVWDKISRAVQEKYDADTDHGTIADKQTDWDTKYKEYVDKIAKDNGWAK